MLEAELFNTQEISGRGQISARLAMKEYFEDLAKKNYSIQIVSAEFLNKDCIGVIFSKTVKQEQSHGKK